MDITERIVGINSQVFEIKLNLREKELADGQQPQLGLWPLLSVFAQPEGF